MAIAEMGTIIELEDLRQLWRHEAHDFTPWLAENLDRLGAELELDLTLVETEVVVGSVYADIVADSELGLVVIENQLEATDHGHLGQLSSYASGLDARVMVWISPSLKNEHRAALEWLNRWTPDELEFYGVEVRAIRIDDSPPAPEFRAVVSPNSWTRQAIARSASGSLDAEELRVRRAFFEELVREAASHPLVQPKSQRSVAKAKSFRSEVTPKSEYWVDLRTDGVVVKLYVHADEHAQADIIHRLLLQRRDDFAKQLHAELEIVRSRSGTWTEVRVRRDVSIDHLSDQDAEIRAWVLESISDIERVVASQLHGLALDGEPEQSAAID